MKSVILFTIGMVCMTGITNGQSATKGPFRFKSGIIEYRYSGDKTGTAVHYIDDYGLKTAVYSEITSDGELTKGWIISSGEYQYMWDPARPAQGMKMKNPLMTGIQQSSAEEIEDLNVKTYEKMGMKKTGTEKFLGRECDLLQGTMGRVLIWNGVLMLLDLKMGEYVSRQEATSVKTDIAIEKKFFTIPKNITFQEMAGF
jgi:hypothetical protein